MYVDWLRASKSRAHHELLTFIPECPAKAAEVQHGTLTAAAALPVEIEVELEEESDRAPYRRRGRGDEGVRDSKLPPALSKAELSSLMGTLHEADAFSDADEAVDKEEEPATDASASTVSDGAAPEGVASEDTLDAEVGDLLSDMDRTTKVAAAKGSDSADAHTPSSSEDEVHPGNVKPHQKRPAGPRQRASQHLK
jgi:hypothetical protein